MSYLTLAPNSSAVSLSFISNCSTFLFYKEHRFTLDWYLALSWTFFGAFLSPAIIRFIGQSYVSFIHLNFYQICSYQMYVYMSCIFCNVESKFSCQFFRSKLHHSSTVKNSKKKSKSARNFAQNTNRLMKIMHLIGKHIEPVTRGWNIWL